MAPFGPRGLVSGARIPESVSAFGAALVAVLLGEFWLFPVSDPGSGADGLFLVGVVTSVPFLVGITAGGYWLRTADLSPARYPRIAGWCLAGLIAFLVVNLGLIAAMPTETWLAVSWVRWAVAIGTGTGLLVGCIEARAIERALAAERAALRTEHLERQRDYLDYLNGLLRHEVLNTAAIINGYATLLLDEEPSLTDHGRQWASVIADESDELTTVIDDVRVLLQTTEGEYQLEPVDISQVLADEVRKLDHKWGPVDVEQSIPEAVFVRADGLVARVFGNLLSNAVEHNDAETPRVAIEVHPGPETVRIDVADNGPGIPEDALDSLFERGERRGSTHGLGLYLVDQLVTRYGGTIEVADTGPDGTRFAVELPAAEEPADRSPDDPEPADRSDA
ncbi:sensor histidine kinase [Halosolutus amylolyticus]|uniref:histidine kinase n=1 Tax=Halosolutus amylolyticus TaxID=2932267 RepID=A0ABD5PK09_9EURY|nr:ATP-binding protein [Halosolutus amylolyticus]